MQHRQLYFMYVTYFWVIKWMRESRGTEDTGDIIEGRGVDFWKLGCYWEGEVSNLILRITWVWCCPDPSCLKLFFYIIECILLGRGTFAGCKLILLFVKSCVPYRIFMCTYFSLGYIRLIMLQLDEQVRGLYIDAYKRCM